MRRTPLALTLAVASLTLLAAGCGDDEETTTTPAGAGATTEEQADEGGGATTVTMAEYSFDPADPKVAQGDELEVVNDGQLPHNLSVEGTDVASEDLDAGESEQLAVDLEPGEYEFICSIAGHADQGMTGKLTVK